MQIKREANKVLHEWARTQARETRERGGGGGGGEVWSEAEPSSPPHSQAGPPQAWDRTGALNQAVGLTQMKRITATTHPRLMKSLEPLTVRLNPQTHFPPSLPPSAPQSKLTPS